MISEDQLNKLEELLTSEKVSDPDVLLLFSNYILRHIKQYENIDLNSKRLSKIFLEDYTNFYKIQTLIEHNNQSISLELGIISHKLIYLYNQIQLEEEKQYGRKPT